MAMQLAGTRVTADAGRSGSAIQGTRERRGAPAPAFEITVERNS